MNRLNPPLLGMTIPAFYGDTIKIPFEMNPTVLKEQVGGFSIKISNILNTGDSFSFNVDNNCVDYNNLIITAKIDGSKMVDLTTKTTGYIQIAYIDLDGQVGYDSTAALVKYTAEPVISIGQLADNYKSFKGNYITPDVNEFVYKYRFIITDQNGEIFIDSDYITHDSSKDVVNNNGELETTNIFVINKEYQINTLYTIRYMVQTVNNLNTSSENLSFQVECIIPPTIDCNLILNYDKENACVNISMSEPIDDLVASSCKLIRSDSKSNYQIWTTLKSFNLTNNVKDFKYKDCTLEQGVSYKYAYQQYNKYGVHSEISGITELKDVDFEHMYLSDKDRQIKLAFNPKVSGFKNYVLEQKQDTIGGKYPYFFRNGDVDYKEFSISGLLSYHLDEDEFFMTREKLGLEKLLEQRNHTNSEKIDEFKLPTTNQVGYSVYAEREFRNALLDWLNNGEEKLFRSPTEGNYLVRLSGVSLTANEQLSRLVSEFNATVTEIGSADIGDIVAAGRLIDTSEHDGKIYQAGSENVEDMIEKTETIVTYTPLTIQEMHMLDNTGGESMIDDTLDMFDVQLLININNDSPNYPVGTKTIVLNNIQSCTDNNYESFSDIESYIDYIKSFAYFGGDMPIVYKKTSELITTPAKVINLSSQGSKFEYINITGAFPNTTFKLGDKEYVIGTTGNLVIDYPPAANTLQFTSVPYPIGSIYYIYSTPVGSAGTDFDTITSAQVTTEVIINEGDWNSIENYVSDIYTVIIDPLGVDSTIIVNEANEQKLYKTVTLKNIKTLQVKNAKITAYCKVYTINQNGGV